MAAPVRLTVVRVAFTRLLLDVLTYAPLRWGPSSCPTRRPSSQFRPSGRSSRTQHRGRRCPPEEPRARGAHAMTEPTRPFAAPVPEPAAAAPPTPAAGRRTRRGSVRMGAAAAGLLGVGVAVGVVIGQATAEPASAGTGTVSSTFPEGVPQDGGGRMGGMPPGGTGGFGTRPDGGTTDGGTQLDS